MFHDAELMPFAPRSRPSLHAAVTNMIENWPPEAYTKGHAIMRGVWPILPATLLLTDPLLIEDVLVTRAEEFVRDRFQTRALSSAFSRKSLFFAEGADWRWQRRAAAPAFRHEKLLELVPIFARCALAQAQEWQSTANGAIIDVALAMRKLTVAIILQAVLGQGAEMLDQQKFLAALSPRVSTIAWRFLFARMGLPEATPFPGSRKAAAAGRWLSEAISRVVANRRAEGREVEGHSGAAPFRERSGNGARHERRRTDLQPIHVHGRRSRDHGDGAGMDFMAACEGSGDPGASASGDRDGRRRARGRSRGISID